jgi:hypothetical protein
MEGALARVRHHLPDEVILGIVQMERDEGKASLVYNAPILLLPLTPTAATAPEAST